MKTYRYLVCLLIVIGLITAGCQTTTARGAQRYQNLYNGYRDLVAKVVAGHTEAQLADLTKEYFANADEYPILITVSKKDESGEWRVLLHSTDPSDRTKLPNIHWAEPDNIHFYKGDNYVLLQTGKTEKGDYEDGLYITMAVKKTPR